MPAMVEAMLELAEGNHASVEALVKSGQIWTAGVQDLSKHVAATAKASFEECLPIFKALTSVKSLKDALDETLTEAGKPTDTAFKLTEKSLRDALNGTLTEAGKPTDTSYRLTEQVLADREARALLERINTGLDEAHARADRLLARLG